MTCFPSSLVGTTVPPTQKTGRRLSAPPKSSDALLPNPTPPSSQYPHLSLEKGSPPTSTWFCPTSSCSLLCRLDQGAFQLLRSRFFDVLFRPSNSTVYIGDGRHQHHGSSRSNAGDGSLLPAEATHCFSIRKKVLVSFLLYNNEQQQHTNEGCHECNIVIFCRCHIDKLSIKT